MTSGRFSQVLLLTGPPAVGKTTVVRRIVQRLPGRIRPAGFYTDEIRVSGERRGFRAVTFEGTERTIAHVDVRGHHRVGKYGVDVAAIDDLARGALRLDERGGLYVIDEIGRMECFSSQFVGAVRVLLDSDRLVLATVGLRGGGFMSEVKARKDVELWHVSRANRDALVERGAAWLEIRLGEAS